MEYDVSNYISININVLCLSLSALFDSPSCIKKPNFSVIQQNSRGYHLKISYNRDRVCSAAVFIIEELLIPLSDNFHQRSLYKRANKYTNIKNKL